MRHLLAILILITLLPNLSAASTDNETCDVLLFSMDEFGLSIPTGGYFSTSLNNRLIPKGKMAIMFRDLSEGETFKTRWYSAASSELSLSCNNQEKVFIEVNRRARLHVISENKAQEKLNKYKKLTSVELKEKKYVATLEQPLDKNIAIAELFQPPQKPAKTFKPSTLGMDSSNSSHSQGEQKELNRDAIAVIIGSKNYSKNNADVPDVDYALNDAEQIRQYVVNVLGYRDGNIIYLKDPNQSDLIATFGSPMNPKGKLYDWVRPEQSDVFVYYSGHGAPSLSDGQGYLLPVNADPQRVELTGFPLETLYKNLSQVPARSMTVVLDACFSGSSQSGTVVKNASSISLRQSKATNLLPKGAVLTAAGSGEVASWDAAEKLGLFTRHFLEGVYGKADGKRFGNGDGKVTLGELKTYLEDEVTYYARRQYSREQHPQISGASSMTLSDLSYGQ